MNYISRVLYHIIHTYISSNPHFQICPMINNMRFFVFVLYVQTTTFIEELFSCNNRYLHWAIFIFFSHIKLHFSSLIILMNIWSTCYFFKLPNVHKLLTVYLVMDTQFKHFNNIFGTVKCYWIWMRKTIYFITVYLFLTFVTF